MTTTKNRTPKATVRPKLTESDIMTMRLALIEAAYFYDKHDCPIFAAEARELLHRLQKGG